MSTGKIRAAGNWIDAGSGCVATRQKKKFNATYAYCMESLISSFYTTSRQHQHVRRGELWCVSCCTPFSPSVTSYSFPPPHRCKKICIQNILRQFHGKKLFGKKNGGKKGGFTMRCLYAEFPCVYARFFFFFFQISGWSSKKEAKTLVCLFCSVEEKKKGTARKVLLVWRHRQSSDDKSLNSHRCSTNTERENPCVCVWLRDADLRVE